MKKFFLHSLTTAIIFGVCFSSHLNAQEGIPGPNSPKQERGLLPPASDKQPASPYGTCGNMGGESGWSDWKAETGTYTNGAITVTSTGAPTAPRFALTTAGVDACTPGTALNAPAIPTVAPGFGTRSIRLGERVQNGMGGGCSGANPMGAGIGCAERITYPFTVTAADSNFIYAYAIIIENPVETPASHTKTLVPYAEIYIMDGNDTVKCSHQKYSGSTTGTNVIQPGFYQASCNGPDNNGMDVVYKPWTTVGINLKNYVGKTLKVVITNVDCGRGGHFCHSYWDFACPPINTVSPPYCEGSSTTFVAPPSDPANPYTYTWYQNGTIYTGLPNATSVSITPNPVVSDVFAVHVHQKSGCDFWVPFIPRPLSVNANFIPVGDCSSGSFTDKSSTPDGSPITGWQWSFPGGTPSTSTVQNPSGITYPPGTYTVTLIVTSKAGCKDTIKLPVKIGSPATANFIPNSVCFNNPTLFNNLSNATQWQWDFGDGNTSTAQHPSHTYGTPGTYMVTLIALGSAGCNDTIKRPVYINPLPTANFTSTRVCFGDTTCFTNTSAISSGSIKNLSWNFGDPGSGAQNISNLTSPCHVYSAVANYDVTLTVTSDSGCQSTIVLPVVFSPPPVALFTGTTGCLGVPTSLTSHSTAPASDPIKTWSWNFGDGSPNSSQTDPVHLYTTPGTFTVILTVTTVQGCIDTVYNPIRIYALPVANFSGPVVGCSPVCNNYRDLSTCLDGTITSWQWSFPGGTPDFASSQVPPKVCYSVEGSYGAYLAITSSYGCRDSIEITPLVTVHAWPDAQFTVTPSVAPAILPNFNFNDLWTGEVTQWIWDFGDGTIDSTNTDPAHSYSASATANDFYAFEICLRVQTPYGCWDTVCHSVELLPEFTFYIPNTVTPNGDGTNEFFFGKSRGVKEYNIWLFDRWGNLVWDCGYKGKNTDWDAPMQDGMSSFCKWDAKVEPGGVDMNGSSKQLAQEDVYVWKVKLTDIFDKKHTYIGHVNIVR